LDDVAGGTPLAFAPSAGWFPSPSPAYFEQHALDESGDGHTGGLRAPFSELDRRFVEPQGLQSSAELPGRAWSCQASEVAAEGQERRHLSI